MRRNRKYEKRIQTSCKDNLVIPLEPAFPEQKFRLAVVIPALAEFEFIFKTLNSIAANARSLLDQTVIIVVVNNHKEQARIDFEDNQELLTKLRNDMKR